MKNLYQSPPPLSNQLLVPRRWPLSGRSTAFSQVERRANFVLYLIFEQVGNYGGYTEYNVGIKFFHWLFLLQQKYSNVL